MARPPVERKTHYLGWQKAKSSQIRILGISLHHEPFQVHAPRAFGLEPSSVCGVLASRNSLDGRYLLDVNRNIFVREYLSVAQNDPRRPGAENPIPGSGMDPSFD